MSFSTGVRPVSPALEVFTPVRQRRRGTRALIRLRSPLGIYTTPLVLLIAWQVVSMLGLIPATVAASPSQVINAGTHLWSHGEPSTLRQDLGVSLARALSGLLIGGTIGALAGITAGLSRLGEQIFNGPVQILNTIPFLALLPVFIMWFGIGEVSKIAMISLGAGIPIYINLFGAIRNVDQRLIEMAKAAGAGRWRLLRRVIFPGALPGALIGMRLAIAYSVLGLVVAEQINASSGLGFMINQAQTFDRVDEMFLGLAIYAILGLTGDQIVRACERGLLRWRPGNAGGAA
jgi:sulfonate transport system permease protein